MSYDVKVNEIKNKFAQKFEYNKKTKAFLDSEIRILNNILGVIGPVKFINSMADFIESNKTTLDSTPANSYKKFMGSELLTGVFNNSEQLTVKREAVVEEIKDKERLIDMFKSLTYEDHSWAENRQIINDEFYDLVLHQLSNYIKCTNLRMLLPYLTTDFDYPLLISDTEKPLKPLEILLDVRRKINKLSSRMIVSPSKISVTMCHCGVWENFLGWALKSQDDIDLYREEMVSFQGMRRLGLIFISKIDDIEDYKPEYRKLIRHLILNHKCIIGIEDGTKVKQNNWLYKLLNQRCITIDSTGEKFHG